MDNKALRKDLGSAKTGVSHWWHQRMSAVALVPLGLWFLAMLLWQGPWKDVAALHIFLSQPHHAVLLILLLSALFYHGYLGIQVTIEDYVHSCFLRIALLWGFKFAHGAAAVGGIFCIVKLALAL
jgi:succinate dehydrogenase / fumarate reductase membrane anchor subunit